MKIEYSTSVVAPRDRAAYWREVVNRDQARHEFRSSVGLAFRGAIAAGALGELGISQFDCDPCEAKRTSRDVAQAQSDDVLLILQQAGRSVFIQDGREAIVEPSDFVLVDTARPCEATHQTQLRCMIFSIPRAAMVARVGSVRGLTARTMHATSPVAGLASGFLALLPERLDSLAARDGHKIADQAMDLIALACAPDPTTGMTLAAPGAITLQRLKSVIEHNLCDEDLKPSKVAALAGISVRYANALLAREDTSLERYILHRRLERCRRALEDPRQAQRLIGNIAYGWGFSDPAHFSRSFRAAYGCTPGEYRQRGSAGI
jgi:AraC-like DNA-binding protein